MRRVSRCVQTPTQVAGGIMNVLFGVSSGSYSDYRVHCVFGDRAAAEVFATTIDGFVEEFRAFDHQPERVVWWEISVRLNADGSHFPREPGPFHREDWEFDVPHPISRRPRFDLLYSEPYSGNGYGGPGQYGLFGHGLDRDACAQVISDHVAQWKAQNHKLHNAKPWPKCGT